MKSLLPLAFAIALTGCDSLSYYTIGTWMDDLCMQQSRVVAVEKAHSLHALLSDPRDAEVLARLKALAGNPLSSPEGICEAAREIRGMLHNRYIKEGTYLETF